MLALLLQPSGIEGIAVVCASQPGITWAEVASIFDLAPDGYFAMLYRTFIDDSADQKQEFVMVAGALMGTDKQWGEFSRKWKMSLKRNGLRYFRSSEYNSLGGEFQVFRDDVKYPKPTGREAARVIRDELDAIIKKCKLLGIASVIPLPAYRKIVEEYRLTEKLDPDPFSAAMQNVMQECALLARDQLLRGKKGKENIVAFVCDDSDNAAKYAAAYAGFKFKNVRFNDALGGMTHQDDKRLPPLQAADMVASIGKEMGLEYLKNGGHVELRRLQGVFHKLVVWDEATMRTLASLQ